MNKDFVVNEEDFLSSLIDFLLFFVSLLFGSSFNGGVGLLDFLSGLFSN